MKFVVVRMTKNWDWVTRDTICIVDTEEQARQILNWCKKNYKHPQPYECHYEFYITNVKQVNSLDEFREYYEEEFREHYEEEFEW